jgi:hypothetical protein
MYNCLGTALKTCCSFVELMIVMHMTLLHRARLRIGVTPNRIAILVLSGLTGLLIGGCGASGGAQSPTTAANFAPTLTLPTPQAQPATTAAPTTTAPTTTTPTPPPSKHSRSHAAAPSAGSNSGSSGGYSGVQQSGAPPPVASPPASASVSPARASSPAPVTHTVTVNHTVTVTKTITKVRVKTVAAAPPSVPADAFAPSTHAAHHFGAFRTSSGSIGCTLSNGQARCDISVRSWSPPPKPGSCSLAWGQGLVVGSPGGAHFVCAGDSALDPNGPVVANGEDDSVGSMTCQARKVGVTCFDKAGHGFLIAGTGYTMF